MSVMTLSAEELGTLAAYVAAHSKFAAITADLCLEEMARANNRTYARNYGEPVGEHCSHAEIGEWRAVAARGEVSPLQALRLLRKLTYNISPDLCDVFEAAVLFDLFDLVAEAFSGPEAAPLLTVCRRRSLLCDRTRCPKLRGLLLRRLQTTSGRLTQGAPRTALATWF